MATNVMAPELETVERSRVKWGSVIAGVLLAMAVQVSLGLLGFAIGLSALNPATNNNFSGIGMGTGIWLFISTLISLFLGSVIASWFGATHHRDSSILHGVLVWGLFLLVSLSMLGSGVSAIAGGAFNLVSAGLSGASQGVAMETAARGPNAVGKQATTAMRNPAVQKSVTQIVGSAGPASRMLQNMSMPSSIKAQVSQRILAGDSTGAAKLVSQNSNLSQPQALSLVQRAGQENTAAARRTAQNVTDTAGRVAWWAFFAVILSLIVSAVGGLMGGRMTSMMADNYTYVPRP